VLDATRYANATVARRCQVTENTVRKWRDRFTSHGLDGLADAPRSGRPPRFTPLQVAEVKALACQLPAETDAALSRWSRLELAREAVTRGIVPAISASTVGRWLADDTIKPWQYRSWITIRDPDFRTKAARVLDLYHGVWDGVALGTDEYVISSDEKPSIQARDRCHPTLPPGRARTMRVEHEYNRGGALTYLAAYDVHRATVFGRTAPKSGIEPFMALVEQVMSQEPYRSAKRVLGGRQRLLPPRPQGRHPPDATLSQRSPGAHPGARLLAQPGRGLLLRRATQGVDPQRLPRPGRGRPAAGRLREAL
jgi:transposase